MIDPYADASIGNVTGSNSVNVFLGIGLAWGLAALYWGLAGPDKCRQMMWEDRLSRETNKNLYGKEVREQIMEYVDHKVENGVLKFDNYVFMTPAGTIWFNLAVFVFNAFCAIQHLFARRKKWGGELGGPKKGMFGQYFSAGFLAFQWFIYIAASSIFARTGGLAVTYQDISDMPEIKCPGD